jgi:hypothetical protein
VWGAVADPAGGGKKRVVPPNVDPLVSWCLESRVDVVSPSRNCFSFFPSLSSLILVSHHQNAKVSR